MYDKRQVSDNQLKAIIMKNLYVLLLVLFFMAIDLNAQFSIGTSPYSFDNEGLTTDIPSAKMPIVMILILLKLLFLQILVQLIIY